NGRTLPRFVGAACLVCLVAVPAIWFGWTRLPSLSCSGERPVSMIGVTLGGIRVALVGCVGGCLPLAPAVFVAGNDLRDIPLKANSSSTSTMAAPMTSSRPLSFHDGFCGAF